MIWKSWVKVYIFSRVTLEKSCIFTNYSKILLLNLNQISIFQKNFIKFCKRSLKMEYLLIKICTFLKIFSTKNYFLWMSLNLIFENEIFDFFIILDGEILDFLENFYREEIKNSKTFSHTCWMKFSKNICSSLLVIFFLKIACHPP